MDITYQLEEKERRIEELQKEVDDVLLKNKELETALEEEKKKVAALADELETLTPKDCWPFPVYSDLLFSV